LNGATTRPARASSTFERSAAKLAAMVGSIVSVQKRHPGLRVLFA
jgi:hypothetical protein